MISFRDVSKYYGNKAAVRSLSFDVEKGEILALLGPNGAGKSTSMKMLTGYLPISQGEINVCGHDIEKQTSRAQSCIGYLPEATPLYTEATVIEFLRFAAAAREVPAKEQKRAIDKVISNCGLQGVERQLIDTLSKGYRQRTCFAQSIIHDPDVIVMDEPTDGLDPNQKHDLQMMIREMGSTKSILLSTHIMEEAEFMADRILLLRKGERAALGTMDELRQQLGNEQRVTITLKEKSDMDFEKMFRALVGVNRVECHDSHSNGDRKFTLWEEANQNILLPLVSLCHERNLEIKEMKRLESGLKELFQQATR